MISKLTMIAKSKDPKADLRKEMAVEILKNTFLIRVALESRDPEEAALIVNAVVESYLDQHSEYHRTANKTFRKSLEDELNTLESKIAEKKNELKILIDTGHIAVKRQVKTNAAKDDDLGIRSAMNIVTEEQYNQTTNALLQTEMEMLETQADLEAAQEQLARTGGQAGARGADDSEQLEAQIAGGIPERSRCGLPDRRDQRSGRGAGEYQGESGAGKRPGEGRRLKDT